MQLRPYINYLFIAVFPLFSCIENKQGNFPEIPVDIVNNTVLHIPLSEIAETITAIELELTDESLINQQRIQRIIQSNDLIFIAQSANILVFKNNGKFVRSIGSIGQGPGEYISIWNIAIDETKESLFVNARTKIICYDWKGNMLMEFSLFQLSGSNSIVDINYCNNELLLINLSRGKEDESGLFDNIEVYHLNDELQIIDSCTILKFYGSAIHSFSSSADYILATDSTIYLYYPFSTAFPSDMASVVRAKRLKSTLRDTLYRFTNNQMIPDMKLKFKNDGIDTEGYMFINLINAYRSSRYIFACYFNYRESLNDSNIYNFHHFCYDIKTGKGYNVSDNRYTDDFNRVERIQIRPFQTNAEMFYYLHTHFKMDDIEEPNPTLYIGKLKTLNN